MERVLATNTRCGGCELRSIVAMLLGCLLGSVAGMGDAAAKMVVSTASAAEPAKGISVASKAVRDKINLKVPEGCSHLYGFNYQPSYGTSGLEIWQPHGSRDGPQ